MSELPVPRLIRPNPDPMGMYFRVGYNDHPAISGAILSGHTQFTGVVVEAHRVERHRELLDLVGKSHLECVLDPCTQASAMPGGYSDSLGELPWGVGRCHRLTDFSPKRLLEVVTSIAQFAVQNRFSEVIAPTHLLSGADDPWLEADINSALALRRQLDRSSGRDVGLIYHLAIPYGVLSEKASIKAIVERLRGIPMDALWVGIDGFGDHSTGAGVRNFLDASLEFHKLGAPIVGDHVGGLVGLGLLATSAVGGLSHGVTQRERFDARSWKQASGNSGFSMPHRVYLPTLDLHLKQGEAKRLFDASVGLRGHFGCSDPKCCPHGVIDMVERPGMHFLTQRMNQVAALGPVPYLLKGEEFVARFLRPTVDAVVRFRQSRPLNDEQRNRIARHARRLELLRLAFGEIMTFRRPIGATPTPETRSAREHRMRS